jgi:hypothetical protein
MPVLSSSNCLNTTANDTNHTLAGDVVDLFTSAEILTAMKRNTTKSKDHLCQYPVDDSGADADDEDDDDDDLGIEGKRQNDKRMYKCDRTNFLKCQILHHRAGKRLAGQRKHAKGLIE